MKYQVQYRAPSPPPPGVTRTPEEIEQEIKKTEAEYEKLALFAARRDVDRASSGMPVAGAEEAMDQQLRKRLQVQRGQIDITVQNWCAIPLFQLDFFLFVYFITKVGTRPEMLPRLAIISLSERFGYSQPHHRSHRVRPVGPIGIAALRYGNLPYQGWDMKPDPQGKGVLVTVTGVCVTVTWLCLGSTVRLKWIANAPTSALKEHYNKPFSVKRMAQIMREAACDFFPDFDAYNHVEGSCAKEWVAERHNYHAMAFLSRAYNFQWSRWNAAAGTRNIVMQFREAVDKKREGKLQLLHVTPQRTSVLKCNEMTQEFNTEPMMGFPFYPDLFTLNMSYGSVDARRATFNMKYKLVETVFNLLQELKLSSFS
ncbi:unnamed protein product [Diatraea saccharalis]|uniref:CASC1 C-terminal domain-containing protein n=1 Tax=Diatraea saccharalis TaxID=40085 RepID=A0A9N9WGX8_9NEOP|nr:unnamed protein product [Diatraea saccharalis]